MSTRLIIAAVCMFTLGGCTFAVADGWHDRYSGPPHYRGWHDREWNDHGRRKESWRDGRWRDHY